ncbi:MAG TPA: phosphotransferase [Terriglobia bacterium]|nr:phosphotransferase [Terriglobia bacterium]
MPEFTAAEIERYMKSTLGGATRILRMRLLGEGDSGEIKSYGYGKPILIEYLSGEQFRKAVLHMVKPGPFGHEHMSDRAQSLLWDHRAFNTLPRHIRSLDVGALRQSGTAVSLGDAEEFFILTEYAEGECYVDDLFRLKSDSRLTPLDTARADALCDYLVEVHRVHSPEAGLYVRRIRELVGHSECIMGLTDSYPPDQKVVEWSVLQQIERASVDWRWKLKDRGHRLCQVHGDFHPWNILFREGTDFSLLDRSRGEWGEAADDVTCLTMNYLFFSLQKTGRLEGGFETLFRGFWDRYLARSGDTEILRVAAPFMAFRGLVMAHPVWYPDLAETVRRKLLRFVCVTLGEETFDPQRTNEYCQS